MTEYTREEMRTACQNNYGVGWLKGLQTARSLIAQKRKEMAADPMMRRSQDPFVRGQREALETIDIRIQRTMKDKGL